VAVEETDSYTYMAVSVFNRWLGPEDSIKLLQNVSKKEQCERDSKFNLLSKVIIENTEVINFVYKGRWSKARLQFRKFLSEEAKKNYLKVGGNTSKYMFKVALPQFEALYFESWDDTHVFYLRDLKYAKILEKWATECGLHTIDKW
jgi:hypothetical protein